MEILSIIISAPSIFWVQLGLILSLTAIMGIVVRKVLGHLVGMESLPEWLRTLCDSFYLPSSWLVWGYGILLLIQAMVGSTDLLIPASFIAKIRQLFFLLFTAWIALRWKSRFQKKLVNRVSSRKSAAQDQALIQAIGKVFTVFILFVVGMIVLDIFEVQLTALLAFGGIGGVAIGFAGKDIVANFFGGLMIHINRHFAIGEWILSPNKHFEGVVEEIGWYMTRIRTFARRPTYIPNAVFIDAIIENPGRMYNRRIKETVGVRYADVKKVDSIVKEIRKMLETHSAIDRSKFLFVHFMNFGASSLNIEVYCFTKTTNWGQWRDIQQDVLLKIADIIESQGAEIALPTTTVHLSNDPDQDSGL
ncbi:mechanosensitive ion channel family protein [Waddlia chondrophila]|uniref:Putative mscS family protein n=1 Tax=Waddlia chondrophila (strain ATCC VR-1470 / WSU 86-1044) TaxID=716544 RepID=D6YT61_WADCW|nr:mechanosensitive ion channel family protein [Waddlia chondrophila]ADI39256.1 putative mscS family protein [Waddlia chondrophila WSU 86-1044]